MGGSNGAFIKNLITDAIGHVNNFVLFLEETCSAYCDGIVKGLLSVKDFLEKLFLIVEILEQCPNPIAFAALISIGMILRGFSTIARTLSFTGVGTVVGIGVSIGMVLLVNKVSTDFLEKCNE